jgi:hypothetical protein
MSSAWRDWPNGLRFAVICLTLGLALDVAALVRARSREVHAAVAPLRIDQAPRIALVPPTDPELVQQAALRTPFDVAPPPAPLIASGPSAPIVATAPVRPRLMGTVVQGQGGFVMVEMPDARMQLVRIGEKVGDLRLRSVSSGEAVFDDPQGARVSLRTPRAGAGVDPRP